MDEQEAQVAPPVAEARELRLAAARVVLDLELADRQVLLRGADHHLGGELHAGGAQIEAWQHVAAQGAHAAVRVVDAGAERMFSNPGQQRVADVAVMPRHRARMDVVHPVADHHVGAVLELAQEVGDLVEVVGEVGVGHHDVRAAGGGEPGQIGAAVAALGFAHDERARGRRQLGAAVVRAVVDDDHLAGDVARRRARAGRMRTHSAIVPASLRHGITTDTSSAASRSRVGSGEVLVLDCAHARRRSVTDSTQVITALEGKGRASALRS